jgi:DNA repair protein RadC
MFNHLKLTVMNIDYFKVSEIKVSYTDKVKASERAKIGASKDAANILNTVFEDCIQHHEEFYVMLLNRSNRVLGISCISKGGIAGAVVDVKIILQTALKTNSSSLIISHYAKKTFMQSNIYTCQLISNI